MDFEPKAPKPEIEKCVFAFSLQRGETPMIMWANGGLKLEVESVGTVEVADAILANCAENVVDYHGIWIWEGRVHAIKNYDGEYDIEYHTITWRAPTEQEWAAIKEGNDPFDEPPPPEKIDWGFGHRTTL